MGPPREKVPWGNRGISEGFSPDFKVPIRKFWGLKEFGSNQNLGGWCPPKSLWKIGVKWGENVDLSVWMGNFFAARWGNLWKKGGDNFSPYGGDLKEGPRFWKIYKVWWGGDIKSGRKTWGGVKKGWHIFKTGGRGGKNPTWGGGQV